VGPPALRASPGTLAQVTIRLAVVAVALGVLAVPAVLTGLAQGASPAGGHDYAAAWGSLYDGSTAGLLRAILTRRFPVIVAAELLLGMTVLFVAPFLSGSARNEAYQAQPAVYQSAPADSLPKLAAKQASASTWASGTVETIAVAAVMIAGYRVSGRLARRRALAAATPMAGRADDQAGLGLQCPPLSRRWCHRRPAGPGRG
jgi:hypothetical protein